MYKYEYKKDEYEYIRVLDERKVPSTLSEERSAIVQDVARSQVTRRRVRRRRHERRASRRRRVGPSAPAAGGAGTWASSTACTLHTSRREIEYWHTSDRATSRCTRVLTLHTLSTLSIAQKRPPMRWPNSRRII